MHFAAVQTGRRVVLCYSYFRMPAPDCLEGDCEYHLPWMRRMPKRSISFAMYVAVIAGLIVPMSAAPKMKAPPTGQQYEKPAPLPKNAPPPRLLDGFLAGPMAGAETIIFAVRGQGYDGHWYANFGYHVYGPKEGSFAYGPPGGKLCKLNLKTGEVADLLNDPQGGVRDPQVHYDGRKILFSYRKGGTQNYNLYEIDADGKNLRQITGGAFDDIEPTYLPDGDIVFSSSRCNRWVNCWLTPVGILFRCTGDGKHIRPISSNNEHENTPWPLPDGRILYMRWEYVDRNQVSFHHLWTINPDGTEAMTFFGNQHPGTTMIDAKPIPGSHKVVASFSPGHGMKEHAGYVAVVDPEAGPDDQSFARLVTPRAEWRDPWAFSENCFLAARGRELCVMDDAGRAEVVYTLPEKFNLLSVHEPRPLMPRPRERIIPDRTNPSKAAGQLVLANVNFGRKMEGVKDGEIRKLLVLETLPMPVHYSGGMEPITAGGSFTLERVLGTVPVEADGSASFEIPAMRAVFFVAMDANDNAIKRMQSFTNVMPGEVSSCAGCHEERQRSVPGKGNLLALQRPPSRIQPIDGIPDVFDFPRDIQPILDRHCLKCHDCDKRSGGVTLSGDRGPMFSLSYLNLTWRGLIADGRNVYSNRPPRTIGASASRLMTKINGSHHDVKVSDAELKMIRYWLEAGAPYPGTYAALGSGSLGHYVENRHVRQDESWPSVAAIHDVINRRCHQCHDRASPLPGSPSADTGTPEAVNGKVRPHHNRHVVFNLTRPEMSTMLMGPLSASAGGYGTCQLRSKNIGKPVQAVFADKNDPDYQKLLGSIREAKRWLEQDETRFDMPNFRPPEPYVREMQKYGILPPTFNRMKDRIDCYATDREYWKSFWYVPARE